MPQQILLIEDNPDISELVSLHLRDYGHQVEVVMDGNLGLQRAMSDEFQLIILDLMLPGMNGLEICSKLRAASFFVPILMLTAKSSEMDRVIGLESGANDYLIKAFSIHELLARVKAIFRRVELLSARPRNDEQHIVCGELNIDVERREVIISGTRVDLTAKEFDLLLVMIDHANLVLTRDQLLDLVWGYEYFGETRTVDVHIAHLRDKLSESDLRIETIWGKGYKVVAESG